MGISYLWYDQQAQLWEQSRRQAKDVTSPSVNQPAARSEPAALPVSASDHAQNSSHADQQASSMGQAGSAPFAVSEQAWDQIEAQLDSLEEALNASASRKAAAAASQGQSSSEAHAGDQSVQSVSMHPLEKPAGPSHHEAAHATEQYRTQLTQSPQGYRADVLTPQDSQSSAELLEAVPLQPRMPPTLSPFAAASQHAQPESRQAGQEGLSGALSMPAGMSTMRAASSASCDAEASEPPQLHQGES